MRRSSAADFFFLALAIIFFGGCQEREASTFTWTTMSTIAEFKIVPHGGKIKEPFDIVRGTFDQIEEKYPRGYWDGKLRDSTDSAIFTVATNVCALSGGAFDIAYLSPTNLDLGGIAKGAAVDLAFERLLAAGYSDFLINLGGNLRVAGMPSSRRPWCVAIYGTAKSAELSGGRAVATSGQYERPGHIRDPRTGDAVTNGIFSTTIFAPSAMLADALSTATFVLGKSAAETLIAQFPDVEMLLFEVPCAER